MARSTILDFYVFESSRTAEAKGQQGLFDEHLAKQTLLPNLVGAALSEPTLRLNLFYRWILEQLPIERAERRETSYRAIDLGSKDFIYAPALAASLAVWFAEFELIGLELDPYRLINNLYRRGDCARYYVEQACRSIQPGASVRYAQGDWLKQTATERYDLITCFLPFIYSDLHDRFGLPRSGFSPRRFCEKCCAESDRLILFHQSKQELYDSIALLDEIGGGSIEFQGSFQKNPWLKRQDPVEVLIWKRHKS